MGNGRNPLNVGDAAYDQQFAYGFGLSYAAPGQTPALPGVASNTRYGDKSVYYAKGSSWNGYKLSIGDNNGAGSRPKLLVHPLQTG